MRKIGLRLMIPVLLILALASCLGGGGNANDNQAAGVEPGDQLQSQDSGELLVNDNFDLPTENATGDTDLNEFELTGTPDASLFGNDTTSDEALFGAESGNNALDGGSGDSTTSLFDDATATVTPGA